MAKPVEMDLGDGPDPEYQWASWLDGKVWELRQGEDFHTSCRSFSCVAHQAARRAGKRLKTRRVDDTTIRIQAFVVKGVVG